jgi:hypothetical protein
MTVGWRDIWLVVVLVGSGLALLGALYFMSRLFVDTGNPEGTLPVLAIAGVLVLFLALSLVSVSFALFNLSDKSQALGLPEGSVRAVIALSLLVLFAILSIFLYRGLADEGQIKTITGLTVGDLAAVKASPIKDQIIAEVQEPASAPAPGASPAPLPAPARFDIYYKDIPAPASQDFAKQLLVLIGTLVTAVAGFYFGSTAAAKPAFGKVPTVLHDVTPATIASGTDAQKLRITGEGLDDVRSVAIVSGSREVLAKIMRQSPQILDVEVNVPADMPVGPATIVTTDVGGKETALREKLDVQAAPAEPSPAAPAEQPEAGG